MYTAILEYVNIVNSKENLVCAKTNAKMVALLLLIEKIAILLYLVSIPTANGVVLLFPPESITLNATREQKGMVTKSS